MVLGVRPLTTSGINLSLPVRSLCPVAVACSYKSNINCGTLWRCFFLWTSAIPNRLFVDLKVFFLELFVVSEDVTALSTKLTSTLVVITLWVSVGGNCTIHSHVQNNVISAKTAELCNHITTATISCLLRLCVTWYTTGQQANRNNSEFLQWSKINTFYRGYYAVRHSQLAEFCILM